MNPILLTVLLLVVSNTFMTFAWYAHLRNLAHQPWLVAALVSWGIALCEYLFQVPANRIGYGALSLSQLKIIQEIITLGVFVPFALIYMRQAWTWNYLGAALCLLGAAYFVFRDPGKRGLRLDPAAELRHTGLLEERTEPCRSPELSSPPRSSSTPRISTARS